MDTIAGLTGITLGLLKAHFNDCKTEEAILDETKVAIKKKEHEEKVKKMVEEQLKKENGY